MCFVYILFASLFCSQWKLKLNSRSKANPRSLILFAFSNSVELLPNVNKTLRNTRQTIIFPISIIVYSDYYNNIRFIYSQKCTKLRSYFRHRKLEIWSSQVRYQKKKIFRRHVQSVNGTSLCTTLCTAVCVQICHFDLIILLSTEIVISIKHLRSY